MCRSRLELCTPLHVNRNPNNEWLFLLGATGWGQGLAVAVLIYLSFESVAMAYPCAVHVSIPVDPHAQRGILITIGSMCPASQSLHRRGIAVSGSWVQAHAENEGNIMADRAAVAGRNATEWYGAHYLDWTEDFMWFSQQDEDWT